MTDEAKLRELVAELRLRASRCTKHAEHEEDARDIYNGMGVGYGMSATLLEQLLREKLNPTTCTWTRGEYEDTVWATSCSQLFILDDGTPADNDMKFCPYCGKPLVEAQPEPCEDVEL
jgi:membrane protease subunit (stomatin/prohibitin family)